MREVDKRRTPNNNKTKLTAKTERREPKSQQENKTLNTKGGTKPTKVSSVKPDSNILVSDSNAGTQASEVYENVVIHYVDDVNRSEKLAGAMTDQNNKSENLNGHSSDLDKDSKMGEHEESDSETFKDSVSSQGGSFATEDENVIDTVASNGAIDGGKQSDTEANNGETSKPSAEAIIKEVDDKSIEKVKEMDVFDETLNGNNEMVDAEEQDEKVLKEKVEEMESKIEKLEEELREVAALEVSLYSVVAEHGSSAHKLHTPARRLSRLYIHACKHWGPSKRATIAKNSVSGLVLIAKSCGSDVSRLTFWLSNTITLREIISETFGSSRNSSPLAKMSHGGFKRMEGKSTGLKRSGGKQGNGFMQFIEDWQETGTFTSSLEKVEGWIFTRLVESVWWQALTPYMQSPAWDSSTTKIGRLLGPSLGDQKQGSFAINLWKNAFQDAFQRLCPVRAGGHECGCLPVLARMVMEQCCARLDVAMFNALLRESAHQIPSDPVSDPIVDSRVLPIPAGDLSFGSGAQLKNAVGTWSRWLTDKFGTEAKKSLKEEQASNEDGDRQGGVGESKSFLLLSSLSDLLMLPKDMLMDRSIRMEVCPLISLELVKRILCNFTPDEFCPDAVPGAVLESLNAESIIERRLSGETSRSFPYTAAPVFYAAPSSTAVAEKVAEAGSRSQLSRNASAIQRKGYTSDDELDELDCPVMSILDKLPPSPTFTANGNENRKPAERTCFSNARYELLRKVWSAST